MPAAGFDLDRVRLEAAQRLPAECFDDFQRLAKTLVHGPAFQWVLVDARDETLRAQVLDAIDAVLGSAHLVSTRFKLDGQVAGVPELEEILAHHARLSPVVHVVVSANWFDDAGKRWDALNARRERLAADARARLVFWLDKDLIQAASRHAPDLWAWRAGVYAFRSAVASTSLRTDERLAPPPAGLDTRSMAERHRRIAEIRAWLANHSSPPDELLIPVLDELGRLLYSVGDYDAALAHWREEELPVYERLGDVRSRAVTMGQIADIFQARGELDEALRIRKEEELPVYERLGDVRERAVCQTNIAIGLFTLPERTAEQAAEIALLLRAAYADARRMRLPEADQIRAIADKIGLRLEP